MVVHLEPCFTGPFFIGERSKIEPQVHQPGGPPLVPEKTAKSLIYNDFYELVASPPRATRQIALQINRLAGQEQNKRPPKRSLFCFSDAGSDTCAGKTLRLGGGRPLPLIARW
jgi:hypothetical protein